jgi:peptidoglycan/xylan/chitin deacetylase (PgdA/CDA1 family)
VRLPGRKRLISGAKWLRSRLRARALVLGYHRLGAPTSDPYGLSVTEESFRAHLEAVRRRARPVALADLAQGLREGAVPGGAVAVTFDDAHGPTLVRLHEVASDLDVPITVFAPTGLLGREPWWERLQRRLVEAPELPSRLEIRAEAVRLVRDLGADERRATTPDARDQLVRAVYEALSRLREDVRDALLGQIETWAGIPTGTDTEGPDRVASADELRELARSRLLDFGSHSVSHPFLAELPELECTREVAGSKRELEELLGRAVHWFSYPNGSRSPGTRAIVRRAGYLAACSSRPDVVTASTDPFDLPRFWPGDDADWVARVLRAWLSGSPGAKPS